MALTFPSQYLLSKRLCSLMKSKVSFAMIVASTASVKFAIIAKITKSKTYAIALEHIALKTLKLTMHTNFGCLKTCTTT